MDKLENRLGFRRVVRSNLEVSPPRESDLLDFLKSCKKLDFYKVRDFINDLDGDVSNELQKELIKHNIEAVRLFRNKVCKEVQEWVMERRPELVRHIIQDLTCDEAQIKCLIQDKHLAGYINSPSDRVVMVFVEKYGCISYFSEEVIEGLSEEMKVNVVTEWPFNIFEFKNPSNELRMVALRGCPDIIQNYKDIRFEEISYIRGSHKAIFDKYFMLEK